MTHILTSIHQCDRTGELYLRYTPAVASSPVAHGSLRFAFWEVSLHAPKAEHDKAIEAATASAAATLVSIATAMTSARTFRTE